MDKRLIVSLGIMLLVFALYHGGYFGTTLYSMLGQTRGSDERQQGGIVDVTYNESCVTVKFINLGYKYGPNHPGDYNIWVLLKRPNPQWICDVEFLECWGVPTDLLDKINWGRVVGSYQCYTGCPAPQLSARFEDLPQEFFREKGGRISEAVGVKFTEWKCPPIVYCKSAHGFHGEGKLILCYKEAECYTDQDCNDDEICVDNKCIKLSCEPDKWICNGNVKELHRSVPTDHKCVEKIIDTFDCDSMDEEIGTPFCKNNDVYQKIKDYYCFMGECEYVENDTLLEDCLKVCFEGKCVECNTDLDCDRLEICEDHKCVSVECKTDDDCPNRTIENAVTTKKCINYKCEYHFECNPGYVKYEGKCVFNWSPYIFLLIVITVIVLIAGAVWYLRSR